MIVEKDRKDGHMILDFTNGDIEKFDQVMKRYNFVDAQALIRFAVSLMLVTEDKVIQIKQDGQITAIEPAEHSVKKD